MQLSIIIPAYNEEQHIEEAVIQTDRYLSQKGYEYEILVVDDGSRDKTGEILQALRIDIQSLKIITHFVNLGKGSAVKDGVKAARYSYCLFVDADLSTPITAWDKFEIEFQNGARVAVASRYLPGSEIQHAQPFLRRFLGFGYRRLCQSWFHLKLSDFNCGFKAYETSLAKEIYQNIVMQDWTFDVEVLCLLRKMGIPVVEIPVSWRHREKRDLRIQPFKTAFRSLKSLREIKKLYRVIGTGVSTFP